MAAIDGLSEVAGRAAQAEGTARSVTWQDRKAIDAATAQGRPIAGQGSDRAGRAGIVGGLAVADLATTAGRVGRPPIVTCTTDQPPSDPVEAAAQAEADADAAVAVAGLSLIEAHRAVLQARSAALLAGDSEAVDAAVRGYRILPPGNTAVRHGVELGNGVTTEFGNVLHRKPRSILVKLAIGFGLGLAYLAFLRIFQWEQKSELLPYLAIYALSGVIGGVVCTNALSWDAGRVRGELTSGRRLWHLLLSARTSRCSCWSARSVWCSACCWPGAQRISARCCMALGELVTMMLIWLGIGNVLSVLSPLRVEPLKERLHDGTLKPFLFSFAVSYVVGLGVNLMLTWRVWAKQLDDRGTGRAVGARADADHQRVRAVPAAHRAGGQPGRSAPDPTDPAAGDDRLQGGQGRVSVGRTQNRRCQGRSRPGRSTADAVTAAVGRPSAPADAARRPASTVRRDRQPGREPGQPVHQPVRACAGVRGARAAADHLPAALAFEPVDGGQQDGRVGDEKPVRPTDHRGDGALLGVAGAVGEPLDAALALGGLRGGEVAVDAGPAGVVHGLVGVDRLVADPAAPAVARTHVVSPLTARRYQRVRRRCT